ncbi:flagellar protein FlgN [Clostridium formicaceticum]|uniref:Flagellar protein FlgN n=1 Tax=Clostridium formicaceticum TaxID=1497 RepID=A0AAC9RFU6_9CLOT|nr:flagellar protein FlgN [Clostridium formicaceticum]AOY75641.1 flagellar protein FlgN [Clostridium formicaceticum]ARE85954.1 FlgN protein [Clostridium formicaceticum]
MIRSIQQLKDTLWQELKMYKEVLETAQGKTEIIKKGKLKELEATTEKEQQYIRTMGTFEKIRRSIFVNISEEMDITPPSSVSELLLYLEEEEAAAIDGLRNELLDVIAALAETNELNEKLIYQNLEYVNFNIELMTSRPEEGNNYGENQGIKRKTSSSLLDVKI